MKYLMSLFILAALASCAPAPDRSETARVEGRGSGTAAWHANLPRPEWSQYERVLDNEPWFEVYKIRPQTYAIYEPGQFEEVISFLILGETRAVLFDTGLGIDDIKRVVTALTDLPITVINSHSHYDHIGGNHAFDEVQGLDTSFGKARAAGVNHTQAAEAISPAWLGYKPLPSGFKINDYHIPPYALRASLKMGAVVNLGGRQLIVFHLPGHAPDALVLYDANNKEIYVGDIFYLAPLYTHLDGSNFAQYRYSAKRLSGLTPFLDYVMTSHNVPIVDPQYLVDMSAAFEAIAAGSEDYVMSDGAREYGFDGFSILTFDPPQGSK